VDDDILCEKAEVVLYPVVPDAILGLAQVVNTVPSASEQSTKSSRAALRRAARLKKKPPVTEATAPVETSPIMVDTASVAPVQLVPPPLPVEAQQIIAKALELKKLPPDFCSKNTTTDCMNEDRTFICSKATGVCVFNPMSQQLIAMDTTNISQYGDCLTKDILYNRIGLAKQILSACVAVDGRSQAVLLSSPSDVRTVGELARSLEFSKELKASGISASTAVAPVATTPVLPPCSSMTMPPYVPGQSMSMSSMPQPNINCTPDTNMNMMPMQGYTMPRASTYIPSTLAQFISIIANLFRLR
jgi:hypothetical protein